MQDIPIICTLNDEEFRNREKAVLSAIKKSFLVAEETTGGYNIRFPSNDVTLAALSEFISLERRCCPFLDFKLTVPRGGGDLFLELSGPEGAKEFIATNFMDY
jgi:hypothetical protein